MTWMPYDTWIVVIGAFYHRLAPGDRLQAAGLSLVLAGAAGNFFDRIWRGEVIDFVDPKQTEALRDQIDIDVPLELHWTWNYGSEVAELRKLSELLSQRTGAPG